ncbi:MAG: hypothetical protein TREMPRED_000834 [Tremellales sp. Tagirdzhanova-0007]|nr:MAG: hypothetical protein TREMPRED_000834 [Tremellales sp. Tagirdzhanova-0007]
MYIRPVHAELDLPTLYAFIGQNPLGLFTTAIPHPIHPTLQTSHIPFVLDLPDTGSAQKGMLRGHMSRANPQSKAMVDAVMMTSSSSDSRCSDSYRTNGGPSRLPSHHNVKSHIDPDPEPSLRPGSFAGNDHDLGFDNTQPAYLPTEILILFQAPTNSYLTPKFYATTKPATGKVVPTWDYAAVQVYGRCRLHHSPTPLTSTFLSKQLNDLTIQQERLAGHDKPWAVADAPEDYVEGRKRGILGLEIEIERCEGRFKLSQELGDGDWEGVVAGYRGLGTLEGEMMARMVEEAGGKLGKGAGRGVQ